MRQSVIGTKENRVTVSNETILSLGLRVRVLIFFNKAKGILYYLGTFFNEWLENLVDRASCEAPMWDVMTHMWKYFSGLCALMAGLAVGVRLPDG